MRSKDVNQKQKLHYVSLTRMSFPLEPRNQIMFMNIQKEKCLQIFSAQDCALK